MSSYFHEDESRPILSAWIEQELEIEKVYILEAIETDQQALEQDAIISTVAAFGSIGAGCLMLALGGITAPLIIPIAVIAGAGLTAWNSDCAKSDRLLEAKFLRAYPTVFDRLSQRISNGDDLSRIASEYGQLFKAYRKSDRAALADLAGSIPISSIPASVADPIVTPTVAPIPASVADPIAVEPDEDEDEDLEIEPAPIAVAKVSAVPTESIAAARSFGVFKNRNPVDVLVAALFSNRSIWGGQRTGKTALAAKASAEIMLREPGVKVFYINLFAADLEATNAMFKHAYRAIVCDLAPLKPYNATATILEAAKVFDEFTQTTGAILILDEASSMGDINGRHFEGLTPLIDDLVGYLSSIRGSTKKRKKAVWTIAPEIVAGNLGNGMKSLMKGFSPVLVAISKNRTVDWEGQEIACDTTLQGQLEINFKPARFSVPEMDVDRCCLIDSVWMPLGDCTIPKVPSVSKVSPIAPTTKSNFTAVGIANDDPIDDYSDLPKLMTTIATMATIEGADKGAILAELKQVNELAKSNPDAARTRMNQFIGGR